MFAAEYDEMCRPLVMAIVGVRPACRQCGAGFSARVQASFMAGKRVHCPRCNWYGTWRFNTVLDCSRISNMHFLALFFRYTVPDDVPAIARHLGIDAKTVGNWRRTITAMTGAADVSV